MYESITYFQAESLQDLELVNQIICAQVQSDVILINQVGNYIMNSGGKRLRPITVILAGKSLGFINDKLYQQAAMIEFIHTSTLLHDDVVDESDLRRGKKTANHVFGNAAAVLVGDFLYTRAFQLMVTANSMKIMKIMSDATNIIAEGEVMQLMNIGNTEITKIEYLKVIENKTAKLFEAAAQIGAVLANANREEEYSLKYYGKYMGIAFQIIDDILDYSGDTSSMGKNIGDDLAEGKPTLPLIYLLQEGSSEVKKLIKNALENADQSYFKEIHYHLINSSALDYCYQEAEEHANLAKKSLKFLPNNQYTETLAKLATESIHRLS